MGFILMIALAVLCDITIGLDTSDRDSLSNIQTNRYVREDLANHLHMYRYRRDVHKRATDEEVAYNTIHPRNITDSQLDSINSILDSSKNGVATVTFNSSDEDTHGNRSAGDVADINVTDMIMLIVPPIILIFGSVCNALTVAVFMRPALQGTTASFLLILLSITDTISLHMGAWAEWLKTVFRLMQNGYNLEASNDITCKIYWYLYQTFRTLSVWILVIVTLERLISIVLPLRSETICRRRNVYITCAILTISLFLIHIPYLIYMQQESGPGGLVGCGADYMSLFWIDSLDRVIIPFIIMLIANIIIIFILFQSHNSRKSISSSESFQFEGRKLRLLTMMLLAVSFAHLVLTIPAILFMFDNNDGNVLVYMTLITCMMYFDQSINFLLYCISGKLVRTEFLAMIGCNQDRRARSNMYTMSNTDETYMPEKHANTTM